MQLFPIKAKVNNAITASKEQHPFIMAHVQKLVITTTERTEKIKHNSAAR